MGEPSNGDVGYGRPPKKHQFKPGVSGNPKGRPKGARNLHNILDEELGKKVSMVENGKRLQVSKVRLAVRQQVNKAAQGDPKAFHAIAKLHQGIESGPAPAADFQALPQSELSEEQCMEELRRWFSDQTGAQP